jgi:hypothetical protein
MATITFYICAGVRGPIEPDDYLVRGKRINVSYPAGIDLGARPQGLGWVELPKSLSTQFIVSWEDADGMLTAQLRSNTFERYLPLYEALGAISELLLAYKLVRIGHYDGIGLRTVGKGDVLIYYSTVDGVPTQDLHVLLKNYDGNSAWGAVSHKADPHGTSILAAPHIGTDTLSLARRYVRCYELLEHGFFAEAFIVAFSLLDDFVQETLHQLLQSKGIASRKERNQLLRSIKEQRLKHFLGPILKLTLGHDLASLWPASDEVIEWLNRIRNDIAHTAAKIDYTTAARGIFACLRVLITLKEHGVTNVDLNVELFRHAKLTAAWTANPPQWVPEGDLAESMDFRC